MNEIEERAEPVGGAIPYRAGSQTQSPHSESHPCGKAFGRSSRGLIPPAHLCGNFFGNGFNAA